MTLPLRSKPRRNAGEALVDCLMHIVIMALVLGLAFSTFIATVDHSTELERVTTGTVRALHAAEQWREDLRRATRPPRAVDVASVREFRIPTSPGEIAYRLQDGAVERRVSADGPWVEVVPRVKSSAFELDARKQVNAWRWDLELTTRRNGERFRRVFSFVGVPPSESRIATGGIPHDEPLRSVASITRAATNAP